MECRISLKKKKGANKLFQDRKTFNLEMGQLLYPETGKEKKKKEAQTNID